MSKKILFIEDDPDIYEILNIIFEEEGYETVGFRTAISPAEIAVIHPDLVLLDVRILGSEKSGAEICSALKTKEEWKRIPVILLSAERNLETIGKLSLADGIIQKPFGLSELLKGIKEFL